jgi:hypothetical protein
MTGSQEQAAAGVAPRAATLPPDVQATIHALQAKLIDAQTTLTAMTNRRAVIVERTHSSSNGLRNDARQQLYNLDLDIAGQRATVSGLQAQVQAAGGTLVPPPAPPSDWAAKVDPDAITAVFVLTALAVLIPLSIGLARRLWRRPPASAGQMEDRIAPRLDRLEQAVDAIAIEVERISESQRFVAKVLAERPAAHAPQPSADAAALGEGKPFLALGAGPMEPIRVAERQAVKQSVTPH